MDEKTQFSIHASKTLLAAFDKTARANDMTRSQVIRHMMREYVKENGQQQDWLKQ